MPTTPNVLVVYFSRAGNAARIAREIARRCRGDVDEILELGPQGGLLGWWLGVWRDLLRTGSPIRKPARQPGRYELVIIGVPAGGSGIPPAVRTYARDHAGQFKRVAFFCAEGGSEDDRAFAELTRLCGATPVATYAVDRKHLPVAAHRQGVSGFMDALHLEPETQEQRPPG